MPNVWADRTVSACRRNLAVARLRKPLSIMSRMHDIALWTLKACNTHLFP